MLSFSFPPMRARLLPRNAAFTLIELLVVISIIAVLAGLLLPVVNKVTENARKVSAKASETQMVTAVNNYQTEYGQYPIVPQANGATPTDTTIGTDNHNYTLFNVLRALNFSDPTTSALNSRRVVYFEGKNVKNAVSPRDGFVQDASGKTAYSKTALTAGDLVDPWGNVYLLRIDTGYSNAVLNPYSDATTSADDTSISSTSPSDSRVLNVGVIAYSYGADGQIGTAGTPAASPTFTSIGDDVISWQ